MDTRRQIVFAALGAALLFGAWAIERDPKGDQIVGDVTTDPRAVYLSLAFIVGWTAYFGIVRSIDKNVLAMLAKLEHTAKFEIQEISPRLNLRAKYLPFLISLITNVAILAFHYPSTP
jgi:hypothetical protein